MLHNKINTLGFGVKSLHKFKTKNQPTKPTNTLKNPKLTKQSLKVIKEKKKIFNV